MEESWEEACKEAVDLYNKGEYPEAFESADKEARFIAERKEKYEIAKDGANLILKISKDIETRILAVKWLILLPGAHIKRLYKTGIKELEGSDLDSQKKDDLIGELKNSFALDIMNQDPEKAVSILFDAHKRVTKGTPLDEILLRNAVIGLLIIEEAENNPRYSYPEKAYKNPPRKFSVKEYLADNENTVIKKMKYIRGKIEAELKIKQNEK